MRKTALIGLFCLSVVTSCNKVKFTDTGKITGPNMLMCPTICCSGYFIEINNIKYLFQQLPDNADIDLKTASYPLFVELNWNPVQGCTTTQSIQITAIRKK